MRTMEYRREINSEDGYFITNAVEKCWDIIPTDANREGSAIRVSNAPLENGETVADVSDYVNLNEFTEDEDMDPEFRDNYVKALHGELPDWKLVAVRFSPNCEPCLIFANENSIDWEDLYIERKHRLRVMFEVDREDGGTDKYLLEIREEGYEKTSQRVTEYYDYGTCEIVFDGIPYYKSETNDKNWEYVYVTEILY